MTNHELKLPEPYFTAVLDGTKTFEVRRNDRSFQTGDTVTLWDVDACNCGNINCDSRRPAIVRQITYVFAGDPDLDKLGGIVPGHVVLALGDIPAEDTHA